MCEEELDNKKAVKTILAGVNALHPDVASILKPALIQLADYRRGSGSFPGSRLRSRLKVLEFACRAVRIASEPYGEEKH
ncbi:hypothetical protein KAW18_02810 [candidate division WOR-3 bacterium]|nr:hypothetical protein [candidate division WOR-3 bacterium]